VFANIAIQPGKDGYEDSNTIKRFYVTPGMPTRAAVAPGVAPAGYRPAPAPVQAAKNPWEK